MIKRVLGILFTLVTLATIVFASLEWGNYRSMVFDFDLFSFGQKADAESAVLDDVDEFDDAMFDDETSANAEPVDSEPVNNEEFIDGEAMINCEE